MKKLIQSSIKKEIIDDHKWYIRLYNYLSYKLFVLQSTVLQSIVL